MKPKTFLISSIQLTTLESCVDRFLDGRFSRFLLQLLGSTSRGSKADLRSKPTFRHVHQATPVTRNAGQFHLRLRTIHEGVKQFSRSKRHTVGLALIIVGLLSQEFYKLFDSTVVIKDWYYECNYWFFWTIREQMEDVFVFTGIFLLFPTKYKIGYLCFIPLSGALIELVHYTFFAVSYETFHQPFHWTAIALGVSLSVCLLMCADYLVYRYEHLHKGNVARIIGIVKAPNVPFEKKDMIMQELVVEAENYNARV